jgi:hypothetical protein
VRGRPLPIGCLRVPRAFVIQISPACAYAIRFPSGENAGANASLLSVSLLVRPVRRSSVHT